MLRLRDNSSAHEGRVSKVISKYDQKKTHSAKSTNYLTTSSTFKVFTPELRCAKHSARITSSRYRANLENHQFEKLMWQQTFDSMGGLAKLKLKEYKPFTTLNTAPYHCCSLARSYNVSYGKISHVEGGSVKGTVKPVKETKVSSFCKCIEPITAIDHTRYNGLDRTIKHYLSVPTDNEAEEVLKFGVLVWWDDRKYNAEVICEWLHRFGVLLFTFYVGKSTLMAFFDSMKAAHRAVNYPQTGIGIRLSWNDVRLYNYSYYRSIENKLVNMNRKLTELLSRRYKVAAKGASVKSILQMRSVSN